MARDTHLRLSGHAVGWYALAFSDELRPGVVLQRKFLGTALQVYRAATGAPVVMDAERAWPVHERHGVVLAFSGAGAGDVAPAWELRAIEPEHAEIEWSAPAGRLWRIRTHPQEIIENTVDVGHFSVVHGYDSIAIAEGMKADGPHLTMAYTVTRARGVRLRFTLAITASGVGYSRVQVSGLPVRLRTVVMPTPVDDEISEVRVITQVALLPGRSHWAARLLPRRWLADRVARLAAIEMGRDFAADIRIWEHKRYQDQPRLVPGDGPIGPYRRWARQFYRETVQA